MEVEKLIEYVKNRSILDEYTKNCTETRPEKKVPGPM